MAYIISPANGQATIGTAITGVGTPNGIIFVINNATGDIMTTASINAAGNWSFTPTSSNPPQIGFVDTNGSRLSVQGSNVSVFTISATTTPPTPNIDLVVQSISMIPANPKVGDNITFKAIVKNQGTTNTPVNTKIGVRFTVNGDTTKITWCDNCYQSLAAGATIELTANGGQVGPTWTAPTAGNAVVEAWVNDGNIISETTISNNKLSTSFTVAPSGGRISTGVDGILSIKYHDIATCNYTLQVGIGSTIATVTNWKSIGAGGVTAFTGVDIGDSNVFIRDASNPSNVSAAFPITIS